MLLYHYNPKPLDALKTSEARGSLSSEKIKRADEMASFRRDVGPYYKHISFFFDPIPADIIGTLFSRCPDAQWKIGATYFEHVINSSEIGEFKYRVVEVPRISKSPELKWPGDNAADNLKKDYFTQRYNMEVSQGLVGLTNENFDAVCKEFVGGTRRAFIEATRHPATPDNLTLYAADVPHVMLYPEKGILPVKNKPRKIIIGSGKLILESNSVNIIPPSARW